MRSHLVIALSISVLDTACGAHTKASQPSQQPREPTARAEWNSAIAGHLAMCRSLPLCKFVSADNPCNCENETFPCKEFEFEDDAQGCQVRLSCIRVASGDNTAPAIEAPVLCGEFGEKWLAGARADDDLDRRFSATTTEKLGPESWPATCDAAADLLLARLDPDLRATLGRMRKTELIRFHHGWGQVIRNHLGMWRGNDALVKSCSQHRDGGFKWPENASMSLIEMVWARVQKEE